MITHNQIQLHCLPELRQCIQGVTDNDNARLTASFQDLDKPVPECQTILDFAAATADGGGRGNSWNSFGSVKLQSIQHQQRTNTHYFYRLHAAQPAVSEQWRDFSYMWQSIQNRADVNDDDDDDDDDADQSQTITQTAVNYNSTNTRHVSSSSSSSLCTYSHKTKLSTDFRFLFFPEITPG